MFMCETTDKGRTRALREGRTANPSASSHRSPNAVFSRRLDPRPPKNLEAAVLTILKPGSLAQCRLHY